MTDSITIIVGAGAVLDFEHKGLFPSTKNITDEILKLQIQTYDGGNRLLIKDINDYIIKVLQETGNPNTRRFVHPELNFEDLLHILEMCLAYSSCWHSEYLNWKAVPLFGPLIESKAFLDNIYSIEYERAAYALQDRVMDIVHEYDEAFRKEPTKELWYRAFWKLFQGSANIYNFNYDTTIEQSLGEYEDGFKPIMDGDSYSRFSSKKYLDNTKGLSTVAHLHGQILFSEARSFPFEYSIRDMVKNRDYETAKYNRRSRQSVPDNQAKEHYIQPYIISGARKTDKLTFVPNNVYLSDLTRKVVQNNKLIIVGYSFGDQYLNELLGLGIDAHGDNFRVIVIDKFPQYIDSYGSFFGHVKGTGRYGFFSRVCGDRMYIEIGQKDFPMIFTGKNQPVVSRNGKLAVLTGGFKNAVNEHGDFIKEFLGWS